MAEALGFASSIVALVQLSASVYSAMSKFYREAKDAKSNIRALATQTMNLSGVLQSLSLLASSPLFDDGGMSGPDFRDTYIDSCLTTLHRIKRKLEKAECDFGSGSQKKLITRSLTWPFASQETNDLIAELSQHQNVLQLALSADTMSQLLQCLANTKSVAKSIDILNQKFDRKTSIDMRAESNAKREEIVRFFLKVNPEIHLQDCRSRRQPNTGRWLIEKDETFRDWMESPGSQIWLSGIPGAGKTILCGTVVEQILQKQTASTAMAFFFCDYKNTQSQDPVNILTALTVQLAKQAEAAFELLESYYEELHPQNGIARPPNTKGIMEVAQTIIDEYDQVYLAIDGLDECGSKVVEVIHLLKQLADGNRVTMALFSRNEPDIMDELSHIPRIKIAAHTEDLELYVLAQMENRKRLRSLTVKNPELHEHIIRTLIDGANGMFRWVACQLDHLDGLPSDARRRKALTELPPTLFETYDRILDRILQEHEHERELCRKALHWIALNYKNIDPLALCEAISIPDDQDQVDEELLVDPEWISRNCSSLIRLADQEPKYPHFQLAHFTVKEYLRSIKPQSNRSPFRFSEDEAIRQLMCTSLRFLTFPIFDRTPTVASSEIQRMAQRNEQHPFYPVAAGYMFCSGGDYWDEDLGDSLARLLEDETMMRYARELFSPEKKAIFLSWVLQAIWYQPMCTFDEEDFSVIIGLLIAPEFSTLHVAAMLALPLICTHLIDTKKVNLNMCCRLGTPLHALLAGVPILFPIGSDRFQFEYDPIIHFRLHYESEFAAYDQSRQCLEIFVQHCADTSLLWNDTIVFRMAIDSFMQAEERGFPAWIEPLIQPSTAVNEDCIQTLMAVVHTEFSNRSVRDAILTLGSNPEISPGWARLASLIQTARMQERDYEGGDIPIDLQVRLSDEDFADGIRISLEQDLTGTLRILLQDSRFRPGMYIHCDDSISMPVLHFAIQSESISSVELLLEAGCGLGAVDESDQWTSLHQCALSDTAAITTLLLESGAIDSAKDDIGQTCWHLAAKEGNISVLRVLIDLGCDIQQSLATISQQGRTPLACAVLNGEVESALLLLDHCCADPEVFHSDQPLLDEVAANGSGKLFQRLHEKMRKAGAAEAVQSSKLLDNINMRCSTELLDYLLSFCTTEESGNSHVLENYLLDANNDLYDDPDMYPSRFEMDHIVRSLLPPSDISDGDGDPPQHFWDIFCKNVVPNLTRACDHQRINCRSGLISMIMEILIEVGVLHSYEKNTHLASFRALFQSLLDRGNHLRCSWIAESVRKVIEAKSQFIDLANEAVAIELLSHAVQQSNIDLVRQLLDHGVSVHSTCGLLTPAEQACYSSDLPLFHLILSRSDKARINMAGNQGKNLLHWAVSGTVPGYLTKIQKLLKSGASIDKKVDNPNADTALTLASRSFRQDIVALLVSEGADSLHRGRDGWSVLHAAVVIGDLRYIQLLLPSEVPNSFWLGTCEYPLLKLNNRQHITQNTAALHLAAALGRSNFVHFLTQHHLTFDVNAVTGYPRATSLHLASFFGHLDFVELLVSLEANVNARDAFGNLAIDLAATNGHLGVIKTLLKSGSEKPSNRSSDSIARLMSKETGCTEDGEDSKVMSQFYFEEAIAQGDLNRCKQLVERGQSINTELLTHSYTPLVRAVVEGQTAIVDWLVESAVEVTNPVIERVHLTMRCIASLARHHIPSPLTLSALMSLALRQKVNCFGAILTPLHVAIMDNNLEALGVVLEHIRENDLAYRKMIKTELVRLPADINNWRSLSALSILVNTFISEEAWPKHLPLPLGSPLHWAIRNSAVAAVRLLLKNEADVNQVDSLGMTPLYLAVSSKHPAELLQELLQAGAGLAEPSRCRIDAMELAIRNGNVEVVKILAEADPETLKFTDQYFGNRIFQSAGSVAVFQYMASQGYDPFNVTDSRDSTVTLCMDPESSLSGFIFNSGLASQSPGQPLALALARAAESGDSSSICFIKKLHRALPTGNFTKIVNRSSHDIASPLCLAASGNATEMVQALITTGADLESEGCRYGSPLMAACAWGNLNVARCLVRAGARLCYVNDEGLLRSAVSLSSRHQKLMTWLLLDRHTEQQKLEYQPSNSIPHQAVWSGPRTFKLALPAYMRRDFGESRWSHVQRLQKWKKGLLGSTLAESRRNSGLDFDAEFEIESRKRDAAAAHRQFLASLEQSP